MSSYEEYKKVTRHHRKIFSEVEKRIIGCRQEYKCVGELCNGTKYLPETWELDHIVPLCFGGTNDFNNVHIICPGCHALKTQREKILFYSEERKKKFMFYIVKTEPEKEEIIKSPYFIPGHEKFLGPPYFI